MCCVMQHHSVKPVFVAEAKATDPVLGGGSLRVRPDTGIVAGTSTASTTGGSDVQSSLANTTQRARAAGEL